LADEYYSFEKALQELNLKAEDLKRLVSEGEIRAFRDEDKMKFKKEDVDKLRVMRSTPGRPSDASAETLADDLIFDEDEDLDLADEEPGMATEKISSADTLETFGEEEAEELDLGVEEEELLEESATVRRSTGRATRARELEQAVAPQHPFLLFVLVATSIPLLYGIALVISASRSVDAGLTKGFTNVVTSIFGG